MKTTQFFFMAALALTFAACSNEDNDLTQQTDGQPADNMITITAQLAPKDGGAQTRAVADKGDNKITVDWAVNEHLAILYEVNSTKYLADATITAVDGSGTATIEFDINGSTPANTDCTIVYPLSAAKDDKSGVKDYATLLAAQDGTLNANLDVRVGAGKIVPGLNVTTQPAAQFAIFKLTMKDIDGTADISASSVAISDQTGATLTTITPASGYDKQMYVALPITPTTLKFSVTGSDSKQYFNMASGLELGTNYYQSTVKLATVGNVIAANGKCYKNATTASTAGTSAVAMIAYLGDGDTNTTYNCGLGIALSDANGGNKVPWRSSEALVDGVSAGSVADNHNFLNGIADTQTLITTLGNDYAAGKAAAYSVDGFTPSACGCSNWFLPSGGQWLKFFAAAGVNIDALNPAANVTLIQNLMTSAAAKSTFKNEGWYWGSSQVDNPICTIYVSFYPEGNQYEGLYFSGARMTADLYVRSFIAF